jgi:cobalamin biosynthesis Mg chelatase CobN
MPVGTDTLAKNVKPESIPEATGNVKIDASEAGDKDTPDVKAEEETAPVKSSKARASRKKVKLPSPEAEAKPEPSKDEKHRDQKTKKAVRSNEKIRSAAAQYVITIIIVIIIIIIVIIIIIFIIVRRNILMPVI